MVYSESFMIGIKFKYENRKLDQNHNYQVLIFKRFNSCFEWEDGI